MPTASNDKKNLTTTEYRKLVEGKPNSIIDKRAKSMIVEARQQLKAGAKNVKIMLNGKPTEVELISITDGWSLVKDKSGDTYGVELDS